MRLAEVPDPRPGPDEVLIEVERAGVNYADTHRTEDSYVAATSLPLVPGSEVVGRTPEGRRVAAMLDGGGYAERAAAARAMVYDVPDDVDAVTALAMLVQGATAWVLLRRNVHLAEGESVVVHAAAGGVGSLAVQLAKAFGAGRVIATAGTEDKRRLALELGADAAVDSRAEDMTAALREANGGRRVDAVLDMTGGRITDQSLRALAPFGRLAFYGMASREAPSPVDLPALLRHSTTVSGMWLSHAFALPADVVRRAMAELFDLVRAGRLRVVKGGEYPLEQARRAHEDLRSRATVGKLALDPTR
nr:zinc-binding dehydrogenase [Streptomonospora nanhaiensis]